MNRIDDVVWMMWAAAGLVWVVTGRRGRKTERAEGVASRRVHLALISTAFTLMLWSGAHWGPLGVELGRAPVVGAGLTAAGLAFAVWARRSLGPNWSSAVTIKAEHQLIERGPYAWVRHPIYAGLLLALAGTALTVGEVRAVVALGLAVVAYALKLRTEEAFLLAQFGSAYRAYQQRVGALVPLRRSGGAT